MGYNIGTFFENSHLRYKDIFYLSYFWALNIGAMRVVEREIECSQHKDRQQKANRNQK